MKDLILEIRKFVAERNWDQFHSPKNLSVALSIEAAELMELFQWLTEAESFHPSMKNLVKIGEEMADVMI